MFFFVIKDYKVVFIIFFWFFMLFFLVFIVICPSVGVFD
ncbi:hypothetical protein AKN41_p0007 (plasmid) [Escherichia coli]|nr:hypothetical protein AKN41_p0007 [Escherichia coli]